MSRLKDRKRSLPVHDGQVQVRPLYVLDSVNTLAVAATLRRLCGLDTARLRAGQATHSVNQPLNAQLTCLKPRQVHLCAGIVTQLSEFPPGREAFVTVRVGRRLQ